MANSPAKGKTNNHDYDYLHFITIYNIVPLCNMLTFYQ